MFVILTGPEYRLPFQTIELGSFIRAHTHRERDGLIWKEDIHLRVSVPGMKPTQLLVTNDNQKAVAS